MNSPSAQPELVVEYVDPLEGFRGWLVIDSMSHSLSAGGLRVQQGLTLDTVRRLAANMTLKMRIAGIRADGAKSGIDYDPRSPGKEEALFRFMRAIRPYILDRYSMGPDLNTSMPELNGICSRLDIPTIKAAVARTQQLNTQSFGRRMALLNEPAGPAPLGRMRAGVGLAASALAALEYMRIPAQKATVSIQGFGCLAASAAWFLDQAGVRIIGLADREKSLLCQDDTSLDIPALISGCSDGLIPDETDCGLLGGREAIFGLACDLFIPAAVEKAVTAHEAKTLPVRAVACGANLAVTDEAEQILHDRGILLIPDMVAGCGGSLSMEGLFGPENLPEVEDVIAHIQRKTGKIVKKMLARSERDGITPRAAALQLCAETPLYPGTKPYGSL